MEVTFLGTGTSQGVPVIACGCPVCKSQDSHDKRLRSSVLISYDNKNIVIDTGPDFRQQMLREEVVELDAALITHSHKDHIAGLDDIRAFNFKQQKSMNIYGSRATHDALKREFYYAFSDFKYPGVPQLNLEEVTHNQPFDLFGKSIIPIEVMHYKMPVLAFRIDDFAYITDAKTVSQESRELLKGVDTLVVNALQIAPHLSHFTLQEAIKFAEDLQVSKCYFTHIGHNLGKHQEVMQQLADNMFLAYDGLTLKLS